MGCRFLLDLLSVQVVEHFAEIPNIEPLAADHATDEVVGLASRLPISARCSIHGRPRAEVAPALWPDVCKHPVTLSVTHNFDHSG